MRPRLRYADTNLEEVTVETAPGEMLQRTWNLWERHLIKEGYVLTAIKNAEKRDRDQGR